ncbi:MAG: MFS transporter [Halobacteriovoraceae bacterium]|nr:MFS transporter [Halobacteriovoraceae bacterium]
MIELLKKHPIEIFFGLCFSFFTCFGQTFLIAQFLPSLRELASLTVSEMSFTYSLATFLTSFGLSRIGRLIDTFDIKKLSLCILLGLASGLIILNFSYHYLILGLSFFLIRFFGQISLGLISQASLSKIFGRVRGKVLALTGLGRSIGEGLLPPVIIYIIVNFQWRYAIFSELLLMILVLLPVIILCIPKISKTPLYEENQLIHSKLADSEKLTEGTWQEFFKSPRLFILCLFNSYLPFTVTGLFFQQEFLGEWKDWAPQLFGNGFVFYSFFYVSGNFIWGHLIDKYTSSKMHFFMFYPFIITMGFLLFGSGKIACFAYMGSLGFSVSTMAMMRQTYWAENFSYSILGSLKSKDATVTVVGTSISPIIFSSVTSMNIPISYTISILFGVSILISFLFLLHHILYNIAR